MATQNKTLDQLAREYKGKTFSQLVEEEYNKQAAKVLGESEYYDSLFDYNKNGIIDGRSSTVGTEAWDRKHAMNTKAEKAQYHTQWEQYVTATNASNNAIRRAIEATVEQELYLYGNEKAVDRFTKNSTPNTQQAYYVQQSANTTKLLIPVVAVVAVVFIIAVLRK